MKKPSLVSLTIFLFAESHGPLLSEVLGIEKAELTKLFPNPVSTGPAYYRREEFYFAGHAEMRQAPGCPKSKY